MSRRTFRAAVSVASAAGLISAGIAGAATAAPRTHHAVHAARTPSFSAVMTSSGKSSKLALRGPKTISAGLATISLRSVKGEFELAAVSFKSGYSLKQFDNDIAAFASSYNQQGQASQSGLKHLRNAIKHTYLYGGLDAISGYPDSGEFMFDRPGTVYLYNDSNGLPSDVHKITVKRTNTSAALPPAQATVTLRTNKRFGGAKTLPAKGTIAVRNVSTESPHFLSLLHVKNGTTRKQVEQALESNSQQPSFALKGQAGTDAIGEAGGEQTLSYNLPAGEYVELCFFPDPQTGMPHALMGMIGIVHLK